MKKWSILVFVIFLALTFGVNRLVNCQAAEKENIKKDMELSIGISLSSLDKDGMLCVKNELLQQSKGTKIQLLNSNSSCTTQRDDIKELVRSGINVLVVDVVDDSSKEVKEALNFAIANEVKVVFMNSKVKGYEDRTSFVGFNDYASGAAVINKVISDFHKKGVKENINVIVLKENENSDVKSFAKGISENGSSSVCVLGEYVLESMEETDVSDTLENAMSSSGKVDAVICSNDYIADLCDKVASYNELSISVTGQDADLAACSRIMKDRQLCTVYKSYDILAREVLRICSNLYHNKSNESISIDTVMVDGHNMFPVIVGSQFHQAKDIFAY